MRHLPDLVLLPEEILAQKTPETNYVVLFFIAGVVALAAMDAIKK
jgi:hypothetical protein